jgi:hypothetical protein
MCAAAADTRRGLIPQHQPPRTHNNTRSNGDGDTARYDRTVECAEEVIGMSHKRGVWIISWLTVVVLTLFPADALAAGNDVGANVGNLLKHYAGEVYGGIVAVISLMFLLNRRYTELAVFLFASIVVAWMVFAPSEIAKAAEAIGKQVFG